MNSDQFALDLGMFPGGDLVTKGLADLSNNVGSEEGLLVLVAGPRLAGLGFAIPSLPDIPLPYEHALYALIELRSPAGAHAAYNALIQRVVSFAWAYSASRSPSSNSLRS